MPNSNFSEAIRRTRITSASRPAVIASPSAPKKGPVYERTKSLFFVENSRFSIFVLRSLSAARRPVCKRNRRRYDTLFVLWQLWPLPHWCVVPVCEYGSGVCGCIIGEAWSLSWLSRLGDYINAPSGPERLTL